MAEMVVAEIGYEPKPRVRTPEEHAIDVLAAYKTQGYDEALAYLQAQPHSCSGIVNLAT